MAQFGSDIDDDLVVLDIKLKQLKNEYDQYFLGMRKREPHMLRTEVNKMVVIYTNISINNTGLRFKFNNIRARYSAFKRLWDDNLRKIEQGTYERHLFKADLKDRERNEAQDRSKAVRASDQGPGEDQIFSAYVEARQSTGQGAEGLTPKKLAQVLAKQEAAIREKTGCARVKFRVVVESGKAKLKATPISA